MACKIGARVEIAGKDCQGYIAYIGYPGFASGKWIGVILDEPKGKNNGAIKGQVYFKCPENCGMFVRQSQLIILDDAGNKVDPTSSSSITSNATSTDDGGAVRARNRLTSTSVRRRNEPATSRLSLSGSRSQLKTRSIENLIGTQHEQRKDTVDSAIPVPTATKRASFVETGFVETLKPNFVPGQAMAVSMSSTVSQMNTVDEKLTHLQLLQENENLKAQITDLNEKLETLRVKRMQDKEKMKEFEKTKLQFEQLLEFKGKVMESQ
ncbi:hypothetical protein PV325_009596, partial [Microctonus aethiopoides]